MCEAGTYGISGNCTACPSHTSSASASDALDDCKCVAGYTAASDGAACTECEAGSYKATAGTRSCTGCPSHTSSASGSDEVTDCQCLAGYTAASNGVACTACREGTSKSTVGTAECQFCPANSGSAAGRALCYCSVDFTGVDGGPCDACSDCTSTVTFTATLAMTLDDFSTARRDAYVAGVAQALSLAASSVAIASVTEHLARRRLLAASLAVDTTVTVALASRGALYCIPRLEPSPLSLNLDE